MPSSQQKILDVDVIKNLSTVAFIGHSAVKYRAMKEVYTNLKSTLSTTYVMSPELNKEAIWSEFIPNDSIDTSFKLDKLANVVNRQAHRMARLRRMVKSGRMKQTELKKYSLILILDFSRRSKSKVSENQTLMRIWETGVALGITLLFSMDGVSDMIRHCGRYYISITWGFFWYIEEKLERRTILDLTSNRISETTFARLTCSDNAMVVNVTPRGHVEVEQLIFQWIY